MCLTWRAKVPLILLPMVAGLLVSCGGDGPIEPPTVMATKLAFVTAPPTSAIAGQALNPQPVIQLQDATGTAVPKAGVVVTASLEGGTVAGATATTSSNGRATFTGLALSAAVGSRTLEFKSPNLAGLTHAVMLSAGATPMIAATSATTQRRGAGLPVPQRPTVRVTSGAGEPVQGTAVTFTVTAGEGTLVDSVQLTDRNGLAAVGEWILDRLPGENGVSATAAGVSGSITFTATGILLGYAEAVPEVIQLAVAGTATGIAPVVRVGTGGTPVEGVHVQFRVVSGGGSIVTSEAVSDASGEASSGGWTIGTGGGENVIEADVPGYAAEPLQFRAWGVDALPGTLVMLSEGSQTVDGGELVPIVPAVKVADGNGAPVAGFPINFLKAIPDAGTLTGDSTVTDAQGVATLGSWRAPLSNGEFQIFVDAAPLSGSPIIFTIIVADDTPGLIQKTGGALLGEVGQPIGERPRVRITTAGHTPLQGVPVEFTVDAGSGSITGASQLTDASGEATLGSWTLGTTSGEQRVIATAGTISLELPVTAYAARPVSAILVQGDGQSGPVYNPLPLDVVVRLEDQYGNPTPNILAWIEPTIGSGRVGTVGATTNSNGEMRGRWYLGGTPGPMALVTQVPGQAVPQLHVAGTAVPVSSSFDIEVMYVGTPTVAEQQAVDAAVARWRTIIQGDIDPLTVNLPAATCTANQPVIDRSVDDLLLVVDFSNIDGPGNVLGSAGPCVLRGNTFHPAFGMITIDGADASALAASGDLFDVMLHELGHVLGFGTIWNTKNLLIGAGTSDPRYTGIAARQAYNGLGGTSVNVPVENLGGTGTRDSHWRDTVFENELMTGFIGGNYNPLSRITARSLIDLGYVVDDVTADPLGFTLNLRSDLQAARARIPVRRLREQPLTGPIIVIYPDGTTRKVPR